MLKRTFIIHGMPLSGKIPAFNKDSKIIELSKDQYHVHEDAKESEPKYIQLYGRISRSEES
jgi:hypothetical protein